MSNSNRLFSILATTAGFIFSIQSFAQNIPYIPYNPSPTKVYADGENKETISGSNTPDTIVLMKNTISFHPFLLVDGTVALGYERVINNRKNAVRLVLGYTKLEKAIYYQSNVETFEQIYGELNYKFFLSRKAKTAPVGLYASPFLHFRNATYNYNVGDTMNIVTNKMDQVVVRDLHSYSVAGGVMLGYSAIVLEMVTLEAYFGIGQQSVNGDYKITYDDIEYKPLNTGYFWNNGPLFKFGVSIGVNF